MFKQWKISVKILILYSAILTKRIVILISTYCDYGSNDSEMIQAEFDFNIPEKTEYWED